MAHAGLGNKSEAIREGERSLVMLPRSEDSVLSPGIEELLARTKTEVGEASSAISRIERLLTVPYAPGPITKALLRLDPAWNPLRSNPRFQQLIAGPDPTTVYE